MRVADYQYSRAILHRRGEGGGGGGGGGGGEREEG